MFESRRQFGDNKLLKDGAERALSDPDQSILEHQAGAIAITWRVVNIGDAADRKTSEYARVIWLPTLIIPLTYH